LITRVFDLLKLFVRRRIKQSPPQQQLQQLRVANSRQTHGAAVKPTVAHHSRQANTMLHRLQICY